MKATPTPSSRTPREGSATPVITHWQSSDLRALARLATRATVEVTDLVEAVHHRVLRPFDWGLARTPDRTRGITGFVYRSVRGVTGVVGERLEALLVSMESPEFSAASTSSQQRDAVIAALNGVMGDHLAETGNPLATRMSLRHAGRELPLKRKDLAAALPDAQGRVLLMLHGLCMNDVQWQRNGHDHAATLAEPLSATAIHLRYNSGLHVSTNGRALADQLEALARAWPKPLREIHVVAHSMGGLVMRSACHYGVLAGHRWVEKLRKIVFLGTPHQGAPLERGGNWVDLILGAAPYAAPFARLGKLRSAGITDLRHGNVLDEDWNGEDRFARVSELRPALPLPEAVNCYAIAATAGLQRGDWRDTLIGDGLVPVRSALGRHADPRRWLDFPESHRWIGYGMSHMDLLWHPQVCEQIGQWLAASDDAAK